MTHNYFAVERAGQCVDHVCITREDNAIAFEDLMDMSYDEMKSYHALDEFIVAIMDAANRQFDSSSDEHTIVNLVGKDDIFIWGILIGSGDAEDELKYAFINWKQDGKSYGYKKD